MNVMRSSRELKMSNVISCKSTLQAQYQAPSFATCVVNIGQYGETTSIGIERAAKVEESEVGRVSVSKRMPGWGTLK